MGGIVTSPDVAASAAGADVLRRGGNAIEAAVAMGAVSAVAMPHFAGLGGDSVWLVANAEGDVDTLLGIGQAAETSRRPEDGGAIPIRGSASTVTTAGTVSSWEEALGYSQRRWGGTHGLGDLLEPAIQLARDGTRVSRSQQFWLGQRRHECGDWPGFAAHFMAEGPVLRQPALAGSLELIAAHGGRDFYEGALAARIAAGLASVGSPVTLRDLAQTRTAIVPPIKTAYRDVVLHAPPPPTQGITTLTAMGVLSAFDVARVAEGSAEHFHLVVEAIKQAFLRRGSVADTSASAATAAELDADLLASLASKVDLTQAMTWPHPYRHGDTVFFAAVDADGRCASVLQSIYFDWGSGVVAGDTGILWHNRGAAFSVQAGHPNEIAPGKRPFMTLNPGLATRGGQPCLVYGTQGADGQPQTLALLLTRLLDFGLSPEASLRRPRFLLGRTFSDDRDTLKLESDAGPDVFAALVEMGHALSPIEAQSQLAGHAGVIAIAPDGTLSGAHDSRGEGVARRV